MEQYKGQWPTITLKLNDKLHPAVEVPKLALFHDLNRSRQRAEVVFDEGLGFRVMILQDDTIFASLPVAVGPMLEHAKRYPGQSLSDVIMDCIEHNEKKP